MITIKREIMTKARAARSLIVAAGLVGGGWLFTTMSEPAGADPPRHAPAYGYRDKDRDKDRGNRGNGNNNGNDRKERDKRRDGGIL